MVIKLMYTTLTVFAMFRSILHSYLTYLAESFHRDLLYEFIYLLLCFLFIALYPNNL